MAMLVLMGITSLAVDIGLAMNERRQDQAAADVGALAALQAAKPNLGCSGAACLSQARTNGANAAIGVANGSLDDPTLADWSDATRCGSPPAGFTLSPVSACVAFSANTSRAWVRIPTIASPTFFARLLNADQINVSAYAIADQDFGNPGPVLPFLLPGNAGNLDYNCLKTGPNPSWGACEDLPSSGNFGSMDFFLYGNAGRNTTEKCSGDTNGRLVSNIARGVDHPLGRHPTGSGAGFEEPAFCGGLFGVEPDMAQGQPGVGSALEAGMLYGGSSYSLDGSAYDGRLEDSSGTKVRNAGGSKPEVKVDDKPLWDYLKSSTVTDCNNVGDPDGMRLCIQAAKSAGVVVFDDSIIDSPRFGFTPQVSEPDFLTPGSYYHIIGYRPVFIDTTYYGCNSSGCEIVHTPGIGESGACPPAPEDITCGIPGNHNKELAAVSAYVLASGILPGPAQQPAPGDDDQRRYNLSE